jgi:FkbM family methyltransferase
MRLWELARAYHRFWRYRLRTERDEISYVMKQRLAGSTIIDIGANRGAFSYWLHRCAGRDGRVVAFEPQPEMVDFLKRLKKRLRLNQLTIVPNALSDQPGTLPLVCPRGHWGGASFHLDPAGLDCNVIPVPVTTLDEYAAKTDLGRVSFIKCDVQDHELDAMRGSVKLLTTHKPVLLIEQLDSVFQTRELPKFLYSLGYRGYFFYQRKLVGIEHWDALRSKIRAPFLNYIYRFPSAEQVATEIRRAA